MNNQKRFGVWMDSHSAVIVGNNNAEDGGIMILAHTKGEDSSPNSSEKNANNQQKTLQAKFFKEIAAHLENATHLHVTGTGQAQEQFLHWLATTPQFKTLKAEESTSTKMSDDKLIQFFTGKLN